MSVVDVQSAPWAWHDFAARRAVAGAERRRGVGRRTRGSIAGSLGMYFAEVGIHPNSPAYLYVQRRCSSQKPLQIVLGATRSTVAGLRKPTDDSRWRCSQEPSRPRTAEKPNGPAGGPRPTQPRSWMDWIWQSDHPASLRADASAKCATG
jgi:hypothetical protein